MLRAGFCQLWIERERKKGFFVGPDGWSKIRDGNRMVGLEIEKKRRCGGKCEGSHRWLILFEPVIGHEGIVAISRSQRPKSPQSRPPA